MKITNLTGPGDDEPKDEITTCWCCNVKVFVDEANEWEAVELCDRCFAVKSQMPSDGSVTCSVCDDSFPSERYMAAGYLFATCEECHEELSRPKDEDGK